MKRSIDEPDPFNSKTIVFPENSEVDFHLYLIS